jgi:hypothetical protein
MNRLDSGMHRNVVERIKVCQKAGYLKERKWQQEKGETPETRCQRTLLIVCAVVFVVS